MVQLFQKSDAGLQLIQTMDDHVGAIGQILFTNDGERLLSISADRTVLVRERATRELNGAISVAYLISRVITLKASPVSMAICPGDSDTLFLSSMDRCVSKFDIPTGRQLHSFKSSDTETNDAVIMGSLTVASEIPGQVPQLLVGMSSTDKSIRVYDLDRDQLLIGEFGHTEGVSDILVLEERDDRDKSLIKRSLVSAGMDGILMIWDLSVQASSDYLQNGQDDDGPTKELTAAKPPLRKVLSRSELAGFQRLDNPLGTPTPVREMSPILTRKLSKLSLTPSTRKDQSLADTPSPTSRLSPIQYTPTDQNRRSPSPVSPKSKPSTSRKPSGVKSITRKPSFDFRSGTKPVSRSEFGNLDMSTEQMCRALRAYRKRLNSSSQQLQAQKELERELNLTLRAVRQRPHASDESAETETDSSCKESDRIVSHTSVSSKSSQQPRHMLSTPLLRHQGMRHASRSRSYDATDGG